MQKAFFVGLTLAVAVPCVGFAQSSGVHSQQHDERTSPQKVQPASPSGNQPGKTKTANPASTSASPSSPSTPSASKHPFAKGARFSRSKAPNYRRVNYRENSRLSAPPSGQVWVRAGSDALLVRLSNNIVVRVVSDVF